MKSINPMTPDVPIYFIGMNDLWARGLEVVLPGLVVVTIPDGVKTTVQAFAHPEVQEQVPQAAMVMVFKSSPKLSRLAKEQGWQLLAPDVALARRFEDKHTIPNEFLAVHLPILPYRLLEPAKAEWEALQDALRAEVFVAQRNRGHGGEGSVMIRSKDDLRALAEADGGRVYKFVPFVEAQTWSINGVTGQSHVLSSRPFLQMNDPSSPLRAVGNVHAELNDDLALDIMKYAIRFGEHMGREGYRGWFGLDVLVADNAIVGFIECNARLTASAGIFTEWQSEKEQTPFIRMHVAELLGHPLRIDGLDELRSLADGYAGSHRFISLREGMDSSTIKEGVYSHEGVWLRAGEVTDLGPDEMCVRIRHSGVVKEGDPCAVVVSRQNLTETVYTDCIQRIFMDARA